MGTGRRHLGVFMAIRTDLTGIVYRAIEHRGRRATGLQASIRDLNAMATGRNPHLDPIAEGGCGDTLAIQGDEPYRDGDFQDRKLVRRQMGLRVTRGVGARSEERQRNCGGKFKPPSEVKGVVHKSLGFDRAGVKNVHGGGTKPYNFSPSIIAMAVRLQTQKTVT